MQREIPNALILLDARDQAVLDTSQQVECNWLKPTVMVIDYRQLHSARILSELRRIVAEKQIDLILYSRNEQVFEKINIGDITAGLRLGYTSFSGIDTDEAHEQMMACWADLLRGGARLNLPKAMPTVPAIRSKGDGTFSLVFDMEQLGGARYGLPRILDLLAGKQVQATFFATGLIRKLYPDALETIAAQGHEIGIHGRYHEYLSGLPYAEQQRRVAEDCHDFGNIYPVTGANFIGRMDDDTTRALVDSGITYFVSILEHNYHVPSLAYRRLPVRPLPIMCSGRRLWLVPIPVETYGHPWITIKNMIDSALEMGRRQDYPHVTVLLHPFRDGALRHVGIFSRMIDYLSIRKNLRPVRTCDMIRALPQIRPNAWIFYQTEARTKADCPVPHRYLRRSWHNRQMFHIRLGYLYDALRRAGRQPVLTLSADEKGVGPGYAIYPCLPDKARRVRYRTDDPLLLRDGWNASDEVEVWQSFVPPGGYGRGFWTRFRAQGPTACRDLSALPLEVAVRLLSRCNPGRQMF